MSNLNLSFLGQENKQGDKRHNFLKVFTGEVMSAFEETNIMKELHRMRTITKGKSAAFPITGNADARYHQIGTMINGFNNIAIGERIINIDDLLISDVAISDVEDAMLHWDVRQDYSKKLGQALARTFDHKVMRVAVLAARAPQVIDDEKAGSIITGGASVATDAKVLVDSIFSSAQVFDEKDVPQEDRSFIVKPAQYWLIANTPSVMNKDYGGEGSYSEGRLLNIGGLRIRKSNNLPSTNIITVQEGEKNDYTGDFTNTVALAMHREAVGTVKLHDLTVQQTSGDFNVMYQATLMVAKYLMGHGKLRPSCAIEISKA